MVLEATTRHSFPIMQIAELGHNVENYILPIGCRALLEAEQLRLTLQEPTVRV